MEFSCISFVLAQNKFESTVEFFILFSIFFKHLYVYCYILFWGEFSQTTESYIILSTPKKLFQLQSLNVA